MSEDYGNQYHLSSEIIFILVLITFAASEYTRRNY